MTKLTIAQRLETRPGATPVAVLTIAGDVMVECVPELERAIDDALSGGARHLVLDLAGLDFIDSASVGALLHLQQRRTQAGGRLLLCSLRPSFQRLVEASGLGGTFTMARDVPAALALLR